MAKAKAVAAVAALVSLVSLAGAGFAAASSHGCIDHDDCFRHSPGESIPDVRGDATPTAGNATGHADADAVHDSEAPPSEGCGLGCRHE